MRRSLPTAKPMRQPGMEKLLDIEVNSTAMSMGARDLEDGGRRVAVEIDLGIGEIGQDDDVVAGARRPRRPCRNPGWRRGPSGSTGSS